MTKQVGRAEWSKRLRRWRASGLSSREFAAGEGFNPKTLLWWSSKLRRESDSSSELPSTPTLSFVEVTGIASSSPIRLRFGGGELDVAQGADEATLTTVLRALRSVS